MSEKPRPKLTIKIDPRSGKCEVDTHGERFYVQTQPGGPVTCLGPT